MGGLVILNVDVGIENNSQEHNEEEAQDDREKDGKISVGEMMTCKCRTQGMQMMLL
jgi:hypothetical protein